MKRGPDNYPYLPGMGPEDDSRGGVKIAEQNSPRQDRLVEDCPMCGDEKGSNPGSCRACANYARKSRK